MSDNNQLTALTAAMNKQATAINRIANVLEQLMKKVGDVPAALAASTTAITETSKTIADGTAAAVKYSATSDKHWESCDPWSVYFRTHVVECGR